MSLLAPDGPPGSMGLDRESSDALILTSLMLGYPDERLCSSRKDVSQAVSGLAGAWRSRLETFTGWWVAADPRRLRQLYVATFDTKRHNALYITYRGFGDQRGRGQALHELLQLYRSVGYVPDASELPDYLPLLCQFAGLAPQTQARQSLSYARQGIQAIHDSLVREESPYAPLLATVLMVVEKEVRS